MSTSTPDAPPSHPLNTWASPLLVHVALVALVLFCIGQALEIFSPTVRGTSRQQMVFVMNPNTTGTLQDLQKYLDDGWRITHVDSDLSAVGNQIQGGAVYEKWFAYTVYVLER